MGRKFGNLNYLRGIVYFRLSPFEQNPFVGFFSKGIPRLMRKSRYVILYVTPPAIVYYCIFDYAFREVRRQEQKNPADYAHET